jgi:hypothetical protein
MHRHDLRSLELKHVLKYANTDLASRPIRLKIAPAPGLCGCHRFGWRDHRESPVRG